MRYDHSRKSGRMRGFEYEMPDGRKLKTEKSPNRGVSNRDWNTFRLIQKMTFSDQERDMPTLERTVNFIEEALDKKAGLHKALLLLGDFAVEDERGEEVQAWAVHEVVGYRCAEDLPAYRKVRAEGLWCGGTAWGEYVEHAWLDLVNLPDEVRELAKTAVVFESLSNLINMLSTTGRRYESGVRENEIRRIIHAQTYGIYDFDTIRQVVPCSEVLNIFTQVMERTLTELNGVVKRELSRRSIS